MRHSIRTRRLTHLLLVFATCFRTAHPRRFLLLEDESAEVAVAEDNGDMTQQQQQQQQQLKQFDGTLLNGGLVTRSDVGEYADLSWDIRDIRSYGQQKNIPRLASLYESGFHAEKRSGVLFPLQSLSDSFAEYGTVLTPSYLFHIYGLTSEMPSHSSLDDRLDRALHYQRQAIRQTMHGPHPKLTADAILSMSMWMYAAHLLMESVHLCERRTLADDPDSVPTTLKGGGLDEFMALWIGRDQKAGSTSTGHSLYQWTQHVGDYFGTSHPEAAANTRIRALYREGATALSVPNACTRGNTETVQLLWTAAARVLREMLHPLVQWFLYHLVLENRAAADLYARALLPQVSRCRPSLYRRLAGSLQGGVNFDRKKDILRDVKEAYTTCFGISCSEISNFDKDGNALLHCDSDSAADDIPPNLVGYHASTPVAPLSRIDLDIRQLRILSSMESAEYASYTYKFGWNVPKPRASEFDPFQYLSLHELAVSATRSRADPIYSQFASYYRSRNYADRAIRAVLDGSGKWKFTQQKTAALVLTSTAQIVFMEIIRQLHESVFKCNEAEPDIGFVIHSEADRHPIDNAVALLVGSMEGTEIGGSALDDGVLLWHLANQKAFMFQTLNDNGYARVNEALLDMMYAAKGELDAASCSKLEKTVVQIEQFLQVGTIQALLSAAAESENKDIDSDHLSLVHGEVLARSILPMVAAHDKAIARLISENMIIEAGVDSVKNGAQAVADAVGLYMADGAKLPCSIVGSTGNVDPCRTYIDLHSASKPTSVFRGLGLAALLSGVLIPC